MAFTAGRGQGTIFRSADNWEEKVVNACGEDSKVRGAVMARAEMIAGVAGANVVAMAGSADERRLAPQVAALVAVKPVKVYQRKKVHKGTRIPVALVIADHWASQWLEYGHGRRLGATRFMLAAARAVGGGKWIARGASRGVE